MKLKGISSYLLAVLFSLSSLQAHADQESATLTRTATSGGKLETQLSKDIYRSVPYQDNYEEQEAYQAEEEYTVDVPYQTEETYYVDIPYQDTETYTEQVPYDETESYQETETYYDNEYRCHNETEYERECKTERMCSRRPGDDVCQMVEECGTNINGERICKTRKVCTRGPDSEDCQNRDVCNNVPHSREKCGYEQVAKTRSVTKYRTVTRYRNETRTRTVTKYRQEARTRTVTKYRQETRTRTVTKYRTVTKCCVTRYKEEFDHTWNLNMQVIFPAQASLLPNEKEEFEVNLAGTEDKPDVTLSVENSIYGYKTGRKDIKAASGVIELQLAPKYNQQTLGEKLLDKVELTGDNEDSLNELILNDKGIVPRVTTVYNYRILDTQSKQAVAEGSVSSEKATGKSIVVKLAQGLPSDSDYVIQISATRSGIVLEKSFSFSITKEVQFTRWDGENFGAKTLKGIAVVEQKDKTLLTFVDEGSHPKLVTQYKVSVTSKDGKELSSQILNASDVLDANKKASIVLDAKVMDMQEDLVVNLAVQRSGKRLEKPVQFQLSAERVFLKLEDLKDKKKVSGLGIQGRQSNATLVFQDQIKDSSKVKTEYKLTITRMGGFLGLQKKVMANLTFGQDKLTVQGASMSQLLTSLGISSGTLNEYMSSNDKIFLDMTINRKNVADKKVLATIKKSVELRIQ